MNKKILELIRDIREPLVLVTIIDTKGSAPRHTGSKMLVSADGIIDEASATARISFEGRSGCRVRRGGAAANERVEDMLCADLAEFFAGLAQGGRCTIQLDIDECCEDPHHAWEAAFRAFGRALRAALAPNPRRAGRTAGVKGTLD